MSDSEEAQIRSERFTDIVVIGGLVVLGAGVYLLPMFLGVRSTPLETGLKGAVLVLSEFLAMTWFLLRRTRREVRRIEGLLTDVLFGSGTKRDREAVDILVRALRAPDAHARDSALRSLRKLAGVDFGESVETWEAWWRASRPTFTRQGPQPEKKQ